MARSANAIAILATFVVATLVVIATQAGWAGPSDPSSTAAAGGVTLHSVSVDLPDSGRMFPGGSEADAINNNCLACHSAGMVLTQPRLSKSAWQAVVDKMRNTYKAPVAADDVPAIVEYLANLGNAK